MRFAVMRGGGEVRRGEITPGNAERALSHDRAMKYQRQAPRDASVDARNVQKCFIWGFDYHFTTYNFKYTTRVSKTT